MRVLGDKCKMLKGAGRIELSWELAGYAESEPG